MKKPKQPSKTAIKKVLSDCAFDPRTPGPIKIIADMDDAVYYQQRAREFVHDAEVVLKREGVLTVEYLKMAIGLLALAVAKYESR